MYHLSTQAPPAKYMYMYVGRGWNVVGRSAPTGFRPQGRLPYPPWACCPGTSAAAGGARSCITFRASSGPYISEPQAAQGDRVQCRAACSAGAKAGEAPATSRVLCCRSFAANQALRLQLSTRETVRHSDTALSRTRARRSTRSGRHAERRTANASGAW